MSSSPALSTTHVPPQQQAKQTQQPPPQQQAAAENTPAEKDSFLTRATARMSAAWLVSMLFHLVLVVGLALFTLTKLVVDEPIALAMGAVANEPMLEMPLDIEDFEEEVELEENVEQLTEDTFEESLLQTDVLADLPIEPVVAETADFGDFSTELVELSGGGKGEGSDGFGLESASKFFKQGGGPLPKTLVYIVDNSNSMTGPPGAKGHGRMETTLIELAKSVNSLQPEQRFYIVLYSDTAYGLYYPNAVPGYVKADAQNKYLVQKWLETVECCLYTEGTLAFEKARQLKPELIYLLGDGSFTDNAGAKLIKNPIKGARIEALGMNLGGGGKRTFQQIAKAHNGSYRDVTLTEDGNEILQKFGPRPANRKTGALWGIHIDQLRKVKQLGKKKKKKK